jgi:choice-of-anchor C domain-containing protein
MKRFWLFARVLVLGFVGTAFGAPFQNGGFEVGTPTADPCNIALPIGSTAITGWTVIAGNIEYITTCWAPSEGARSLDLVGNGNIGGVRQAFDTVSGATYQVSFDLAGNYGLPPVIKPLSVTVAGTTNNYTFDTTGKSAGNMGWVARTFTFTATGSTSTIDFVSDLGATGTFAGAALDNVSIVRTFAATSTGLFSSLNPSGFGTGVTFTVQVLGTINSPTGTIDFTDNGSAICTAVPLGPTGSPLIATADCTTSSLAIGNHTIAATYSGDVLNAGSGNTLLQVVNPVVIGDTPWVGSGGGTPLPSTTNVLSDGTTGPAIFTYSVALPPLPGPVYPTPVGNGAWTFATTAVAPGTYVVPWTYAGFHAYAGVTVGLTAFITRAGVTGTDVLVNDGPVSCCTPPSSGFAYYGTHTFAVIPGDTYGFMITGSNGDLDGRLNGTLAVNVLPTTTTLASGSNPAAFGSALNFTATVTGTNPTGTVMFTDGIVVIPGCGAVALAGGGNTRTAVCSTNSLVVGNHTIAASYRGDTGNAGSADNRPQTITPAAPAFAAPTLVRVIATSSNDAYLIGRADVAPLTPVTFNAYSAASCNAGALVGGSSVGSFTAATDASGYFGAAIPNVASGNFVAVQLTAPQASGMSACTVSSGDNDFWPRALQVVDGSPSPRDFIDASGKARWYKFSVTPGQKITVTLSGLPADYDLAIFKDINQAFLDQVVPTGTASLTKLSAEFAPSTFSPSTFSPSTFSPSTFSPDAYAPSTFSPSTFSPSLYSPSTFSPSTFSPSTFSPSTFSPSTFSPSTFSPSTFSPSTFSPSTFSPASVLNLDQDQVKQAFSSAQTRSIIGVSATPGTGDESVFATTWNDTGDFYVRVSGRGGAFSTNGEFTLSVAKSATTCGLVTNPPPGLSARAAVTGSGRQTIILTDSTRVAGDSATLLGKLAALASNVAGVVVDLKDDVRVLAFRAQADAHADCPYAKNLLAQEIKSIVDAYRAANAGMRYVVIAGNDNVIPFFRYPDESLLGQESAYVPPVRSATASDASLRQDFVLSQDAYGSSTSISMRGIDFPVPGLAVGRLVETSAEMTRVIDAFLATGSITPTTSLVTGYDFLADAADAVTTELQAGIGAAPQSLMTANGVSPQSSSSWTATQLRSALFGSRHDVIFLAGHFSANSALAADFTTSLLTTELAASTTDFTNSIVFSAGCHAGYNIVDSDAIDGVTQKLDWPQAFAQKGATLIAGTGYQYGDTEFIEYSERLYKNFARQLRAGTTGTVVTVGEALVKAKLDYLAATPEIRGIHQKALLEATVFGLPMLGVNMPFGREPNPVTAGVINPVPVASGLPAATLGLQLAPLSLTPSLGASSMCLKNPPYDAGAPGVPQPPCSVPAYTEAAWLTGPDGVTSNPAEPVLPLQIVNVTPTTNVVLRGVGFVGGSYTESIVVPLTGAPTTELRGVHTPFLSPVFFPMRLSTPNYFGALSGSGGTKLLVTPVQHRAADIAAGTSTRRTFTNLDLRLYYSGNTTATALSAAPTIVSVSAASDSGGVIFAARVVGDPAAAIHEVWVTYTGDSPASGAWTSLPLTQCSSSLPVVCGTTTDSQLWMAQLPPQSGNLKYIVQAVNGVGLVSADDNLGAYFSVGGTPPVATTLALVSPPNSATYGDNTPVTAKLSAGAAAVAGKLVTVSVGGTSQSGVTDANGNVTVNVPVASQPGTYQLTASFTGDQDFLPSSVSSGGFVVGKAPSNLVALSPLGATLTGTIGGSALPIDGSVAFLLTSSRGETTAFAITDYLGQAILPPPGLAAGTYTIVAASFGGNATYQPTTLIPTIAQTFTIAKANQTITFGSLSSEVYGNPDFTVTAATTSSLTVAFGAGGPCTVTGNVVHITGTGTCTITASQAGNLDFNAATPVSQSFAIGKAVAAVALDGLAQTFDGTTKAATATTTPGGLSVNFGYTQAGIPVTPMNAGSYVVTATVNDVNYQGSASATLTIAKATLIVSATVSPSSFTYGDDLPPSPIAVTYGSMYSGTLACLLNSTPPTLTGKPPAAPVPVGTYTIVATLGAGQLSPSCNPVVTNTATLTVNKAQATFASIAAALIAPARTTVSITGQLHRFDKPAIYPKAADLGGGAFAVALRNAGGTVKTYSPSPGNPNGTFTITDNSLAPDAYTLEFKYTGGPTFLAATQVTSSLRIVGSASTGSMSQSRTSHTATLLNDGRVLVAGGSGTGDDDRRASRTAEIYCPNPYTPPTTPVRTLAQWCPNGLGKFSPAGRGNTAQVGVGNLVQPRTYHSATLLPNGTVLLVGGFDGSGLTTATAELYDATDPIADKFTAVANLPANAAAGHTATLVTKSGKAFVLVIGGFSASSQLYDTTTKTWSRSGTMTAVRSSHTATLVGTKVFVAGGTDILSRTLQTTTIYDIGTGTFSNGPTMLAPRELHTASAIANGKVLLAGGRASTGIFTNTVQLSPLAEVYDPSNATTPFAASTFASGTGRFGHSASALIAANGQPDGRVLVAGGAINVLCGQQLAATELYSSGAFTVGSALAAARVRHTATVLKDGRVLIAGGRGATGSTCRPLNTAEIWNGPPSP